MIRLRLHEVLELRRLQEDVDLVEPLLQDVHAQVDRAEDVLLALVAARDMILKTPINLIALRIDHADDLVHIGRRLASSTAVRRVAAQDSFPDLLA